MDLGVYPQAETGSTLLDLLDHRPLEVLWCRVGFSWGAALQARAGRAGGSTAAGHVPQTAPVSEGQGSCWATTLDQLLDLEVWVLVLWFSLKGSFLKLK